MVKSLTRNLKRGFKTLEGTVLRYLKSKGNGEIKNEAKKKALIVCHT